MLVQLSLSAPSAVTTACPAAAVLRSMEHGGVPSPASASRVHAILRRMAAVWIRWKTTQSSLVHISARILLCLPSGPPSCSMLHSTPHACPLDNDQPPCEGYIAPIIL